MKQERVEMGQTILHILTMGWIRAERQERNAKKGTLWSRTIIIWSWMQACLTDLQCEYFTAFSNQCLSAAEPPVTASRLGSKSRLDQPISKATSSAYSHLPTQMLDGRWERCFTSCFLKMESLISWRVPSYLSTQVHGKARSCQSSDILTNTHLLKFCVV